MAKQDLFPHIQPRRSKEQGAQERENRIPPFTPLEAPTVTMEVASPKHGLRIALVMDAQVKDGVPTDHLVAYGRYIAAKQPDVIVCIGDWYDFPSLSFHNKPGSIELEGRRYIKDMEAGHRAMESFLTPIVQAAGYNPLKLFTLGNHDILPSRQAAEDARLEGTLVDPTDYLQQVGWKTVPFLQPVVVGGVAFCHYFQSGVMGRPMQTAPAMLRKLHMSAVAGHQQGRDIAYARRADGNTMTGIISGSFYQHDERYLSPFANGHWRGTWFLHEVRDGQFDEMALSINFLKRKFA